MKKIAAGMAGAWIVMVLVMAGTGMAWAQEATERVGQAEQVTETEQAGGAERVGRANQVTETEHVSRGEQGPTGQYPAEVLSQDGVREWNESMVQDLDLREAQESLDAILGKENFSLGQAVKKLMRGELPWTVDTFVEMGKDALLGEVDNYRKTAVYLLGIIIASAVFSNFVTVFDKGQIADISYYTMYLLMITLLMKVFASMSQIAQSAVDAVLTFMEALLPACMMTLYLTAGSITAMGFYQLTLWAVAGVQWMFGDFLLPAVQIYVILLFVNQLMKEDYLSKMADLVKMGILWCLRTVTAVLFGMQAMQYMAAPAVDHMKSSVVNKAVSAIPGLGGAYETVTQTILGSAVVLKNAVGLAGVAALVFLGLVPVLKLACGVLLYRALGAVAQPVADKRVAECIASVSAGGELLLKIVLHTGILFMISLALITVMVRGG